MGDEWINHLKYGKISFVRWSNIKKDFKIFIGQRKSKEEKNL